MNLTINRRPFTIVTLNGKPMINGMSTKCFIAQCKKKGDTIAMKHLLAVSAQVVCGGQK